MSLPPGSPQATASAFVHSILTAADLRLAWAVVDESLRTAIATDWVESNAEHIAIKGVGVERAIDWLVTTGSLHPLWPHFAKATMDYFGRRWAGIDLAVWGWAMNPRLLAVDCERVILIERDRGHVEFVMRHSEAGWTVAEIGYGGSLAEPLDP